MAEIIESYNPGWVKSKDGLKITENFSEILKFYVFGTPCELVSSSGKNMSEYGWKRDVWKRSKLREYLLNTANLGNKGYKKVKKTDEMSNAATNVGLGGNFHKARSGNSLVYYSNGRNTDILTILYYIRCAIAHGRFQIYSEKDDVVYAFEAVTKKRGSKEFIVKARMILSEKILIEWKNTIVDGPINFKAKLDSQVEDIRAHIKRTISENNSISKNEIISRLPYESSVTSTQIKYLTTCGAVFYDKSKKVWKIKN